MDGEDSDLEAFEANLSTIIQSRALVSVLFSPEHFRPSVVLKFPLNGMHDKNLNVASPPKHTHLPVLLASLWTSLCFSDFLQRVSQYNSVRGNLLCIFSLSASAAEL